MRFPPINLWSIPKQWRDYKMFKTQDEMEEIMVSDHAKAMQQASGEAYNREFNRYFKDVSNLNAIDVYKVLELFDVRSHAIGHAIKKLLVAGARGAKDEKQDVSEAIAALKRHLEILEGK